MKKISTLLLAGLALAGSLSAQNKTSFFHVGVIPRSYDKEYTNTISFNLISGSSMNEKAFTFSGISTVVSNQANGLQFAGLFNTIGTGRGILFGGLANISGGNYHGVQFAGLTNISGDTNGIQFAGLGNISGFQRGLQFGGLGNINGNMSGVQFGGLGNITGNGDGLQFGGIGNISGNFNGWQIAGINNITGNINGLQFAGLGNISGNIRGVQVAGLGNIAGNLNGLQFSGGMNTAGNIKGVQIAGLVNKAKHVKGVQFAGLMNIAEESDYPIGILNFIKNGEKSIGLTYDETGSIIAGLRTGGRVLYGILGVGINHKANDEKAVLQGGFGAHIPIVRNFRINCELTQQYLSKWFNGGDSYVSKSSLQILPAYSFCKKTELFAGPTLNYRDSDNICNNKIFPDKSLWNKQNDTKIKQLYIGYTVGMNYRF